MSTDSTQNKLNGRYVLGGSTEVSTGMLEWWERGVATSDPSDLVYVLETKYEGRADLLAYLFYGDAGFWWVIPQYNNLIDPTTELVAGTVLQVPSPTRIQGMFTPSGKQGGVASTRT